MYSILCSGYPEETRYKLYERLGKCQIKLNRPMKAKPALLIASQLIRKSGLGEEKEKQLLKSIAKLQESIKKSTVISSTVTPVRPLTQFPPLFLSQILEGLFELTRAINVVMCVLNYKNQRRAHSLSGCVNLDSTPLLLGGTGVYYPPLSHYCSWSWN